jgi:hypothetical protein
VRLRRAGRAEDEENAPGKGNLAIGEMGENFGDGPFTRGWSLAGSVGARYGSRGSWVYFTSGAAQRRSLQTLHHVQTSQDPLHCVHVRLAVLIVVQIKLYGGACSLTQFNFLQQRSFSGS